MWRRVDLDCLLLHLLSIASLWCEVSAQSGADGPCNTCPVECIGRHCERHWWTTMWGFIVTLVALTMDAWGFGKPSHECTIGSVSGTLLASVLNPLAIIWHMLHRGISGVAMLGNLREALGDDIIAPLYPWSKSHIKIVMGTEIVVNLSPDASSEVCNFNTFEENLFVEDYSEAVVIGAKVQDSRQYNLQLTSKGKLALLRSTVLPPYDELKILRGSSNLAMAVAATQAIGYMYGIVVRCIQGLRVSPVEAIACLLNIVVLMKVVLNNFTSLAHRPLLLYLLPGEEEKFIEECKSVKSFKFKTQSRYRCVVFLTIVSLSAVTVYFILNFRKYLNVVCVVPIIMFEVTLVLEGVVVLFVTCSYKRMFQSGLITTAAVIVLLNGVGYVWALVVTFKYWKVEEFDVQSSNYLSQILPYIG